MALWSRLIRFKDPEGNIHFGEPTEDFTEAQVWDGPSILNLSKLNTTKQVEGILSPYEPDTILCIGLNYVDHAKEGGFPIPKYPVMFHKSKNTTAGPFSDITIPKFCKELDYENELCVILAKDVKDVTEEEALDHVLGYCIGNDVSSREWQHPASSGGQFSYAKSFDGFMPLGPGIIAAHALRNANNLAVITRVNGVEVQRGSTRDMVFNVAAILAFLSRGTTIPAGTLIMSGTPAGVAAFRTKPPQWLGAGDVVECEIEGIGSIKNKFVNTI